MAKTASNRSLRVLNDNKRRDLEQVESERPTKRLKTFLGEDETSAEESTVSGNDRGVSVRNEEPGTAGHGFKVNHEFAKRFEHNKKREELHKRE